MRRESVVGWDLGGAHLKAARLGGSGTVENVVQIPCPLWQGLPHLHAALEQAAEALGRTTLHGLTMTGEMVDLFPDRAQGVTRLVGEIRQRLPDAELLVYAGSSGFVDSGQAADAAERIASANWLASATLVASRVEAALFIDIGSTTTDLAVVQGGTVRMVGQGDSDRLLAGELLYTGVVRTPVMALAEEVPFSGAWVPVMAEYFASAADVHRLTGRLPQGADELPAADGGEKTVTASARRLARMIGRDLDSAPPAAWRRLGEWLARAQARRIEDACDRLLSRGELPDDAPVVGAGVGRFIAEEFAGRRNRPYLDFGRLLPEGGVGRERISDCAPAVAVAWLAQRTGA
ncbi:MAG TPA: hydantoinase/oxoprolinase family protein [Gemmatimonadales bacterium]|jgi:probable H4MPT-linked C1 transfer pathway protein|nr:hydantoinase/oxoprolinase family protein [Gemmatimonadales bacterium]